MASRAAGTQRTFPKALGQSFCILFLSYFLKAKSKDLAASKTRPSQ
tara:strand:- start:627 stop:764 length:138 start_codon:yes stop_codon:yes gene_type:complete